MEATLIEKEKIAELKFPKEQVISSAVERDMLRHRLEEAVSLGNLSKHKVKILFQDDVDIKMVETTIWAVTEKNVMLKAGVSIPLNRILSVSFIGPVGE